MRARPDIGQVGVGLLVALLGFGAVVQVRIDEQDQLDLARRSDLVLILDGLSQRSDRLEAQIDELQATRAQLQSEGADEQSAIEQTAARARQLGVLAGTAPATGPGIVMTVIDPEDQVPATTMLSAIHELRTAGAEAIQIEDGQSGVRVVASTYIFEGDNGGLNVGGQVLRSPYTLTAIGDPVDLASAMEFPLGAIDKIEDFDGRAVVSQRDRVEVDVVLPGTSAPQYAQPAPAEDSD